MNASLNTQIEELCRRDADMRRAFEEVGLPPARESEPDFPTALRIIVAQQVSRAAAQAIWSRLEQTANPLTPPRLLQCDDIHLRKAGLSRQKIGYARSLSEFVESGELDFQKLQAMEDEEAIRSLTKVKGFGRWSAENFLLFALNRPDIFPAGDEGLKMGAQMLNKLPKRPTEEEMRRMSDKWQPFRSAAARMLWHYRGSANPNI